MAVVVTHNRRELLRECLAAVRAQHAALDEVIVIDNASTDGTLAMLREDFRWTTIVPLEANVGGAGGFREGLRMAHERGADWTWLLDDDTLARPDTLAELLSALRRYPELPRAEILASSVEWRDGRSHPMNIPIIRRRDIPHLVECCERGLAPIRTATFVSLLVARSAIERCGLPLAHYFIWADDIEYTCRVLRYSHGYLVPGSVVEHRTASPHTSVQDTGSRFYYHVRNTLFMASGNAWTPGEKPALLWHLVASILRYLRANRFDGRSRRIVLRGMRDGLRPPLGGPAPP